MTLKERIDLLAKEIGLSEEMKKDLEDFVDNYIGTE